MCGELAGLHQGGGEKRIALSGEGELQAHDMEKSKTNSDYAVYISVAQ